MNFSESLFLIGDLARPEFISITASCRNLIAADPHLTAKEYADIDTLLNTLSKEKSSPMVRFILLFESRPGEFPPDSVRQLRFRFPLAPTLLLAGPLCEGEGRTGTLPAGTVRIYTYEWQGAGERDFSLFLKTSRGRFALPPTANSEDFFKSRDWSDLPVQSPPLSEKEKKTSLCCIISPDPAMRELLAAIEKKNYILREKRFCSEILEEPDAAKFKKIVIDSFEKDGTALLPSLKELEQTCPNASFDVLLFAPRPDEIRLLTTSARDLRVIPKPFEIGSLNELTR